MTPDFEIVERVVSRNQRGVRQPLAVAVVASADTGKAVRVVLPEGKKDYQRFQNAVRLYVSRYHRELKVVGRSEDGYTAAIFWAERKEPAKVNGETFDRRAPQASGEAHPVESPGDLPHRQIQTETIDSQSDAQRCFDVAHTPQRPR